MKPFFLFLGILLVQDAPTAKSEGLTCAARGLIVVKGQHVKNFNKSTYTGDTLFLKLLFRDPQGNVAKPVSVLTASVAPQTERLATITRPVKKESWKAEAGRSGPATASPDLIAFDEKTGEHSIGLVKKTAGVAE